MIIFQFLTSFIEVVLAFVLILLLLVLLAPIVFTVYAEKQERIIAKVRVTWLKFAIAFKADYDEKGFIYHLKTFGGELVTNEYGFTGEDEAEESAEDDGGKKGKKKKKKSEDEAEDAKKESKDGAGSENKVDGNENISSQDPEAADFVNDDSDFKPKKQKLGAKLDALFMKVQRKVEGLYYKYIGTKEKAERYKKLYDHSTTKQAIEVVKTYLIKLLLHIKPRKFRGKLNYGTGDPASTGKNIGYMAALYPLYGDNFDITPDFYEKVMVGDVFIKGRIRLINVLYYAVRIYFNKYVRVTLKRIKKIGGKE